MTKRERERKIKMFGMIGMSILVISSLATATYAWFTKINVTASTGVMTVSTIEQTTWKFYAYNGNLDENYTAEGAFADDFTEITDLNKSTLATTAGLFAGDAVTFCIEVTGMEGDSYDISLDLTGVRSNTWYAQKGGNNHRYARKTIGSTPTTREANVGWAMDIYTMGDADNSIYLDGSNWSTDKYEHTFENDDTYAVDAGANKKNLFTVSSAAPSGGSYFIFYQAYFSDDNGTHFTEQADYHYAAPAEYPRTSEPLRYFLYDDVNGNSNLYAGLRFELTNLSLDVKAAAS